MKRYKLIKEYPGSPKLGYIIREDGFDPDLGILPEPKHYPEFWEEVIEKDYEILSLINLDGDISKSPWYCLDEMIIKFKWKIHSVKRLSDSEVFTVGDICKTTKSEHTLLIDEIVIVDDILRFNCGNVKGVHCTLHNELYKIKKPLFTTEDGVDVYDGDNYTSVVKNELVINNIDRKAIEEWRNIYRHDMFLFFSNSKKAKEYIIRNKPCLSIQDVLNVFEWENGLGFGETVRKLKSNLEKLIEQKNK